MFFSPSDFFLYSAVGAQKHYSAELVVPHPLKIECREDDARLDAPLETVLDETRTELGCEGYELVIDASGSIATASTKRGLYYAECTWHQLMELGTVSGCRILDGPKIDMRAVMLDLARCKERHDYYYHTIDQLSKWKVNTVFLHITDHSGCTMEFDSHPSIVTRNAFTKDEMRDFIAFAESRYIELIPEIETFGHAKYITKTPGYEDLGEVPENPRSMCTSNPRTWEVVRDLIMETAEVFPSKYLHAGCDEAVYGECEKCSAWAEKEGIGTVAATHIKKACEIVKEAGKVPMVWGDVLLKHRESVHIVPDDVIITHWDYRPDVTAEPVQFLQSLGYKVLACPASVWGSRMIIPRDDVLDNLENFTRIAMQNDCIGVDNTVWVPQRYMSDTLWYALAYGAELAWSGLMRDRIDFARAFAKQFYGLQPSDENAHLLTGVHQISEKGFVKIVAVDEYVQDIISGDLVEKLDKVEKDRDTAANYAKSLALIRDQVTKHETEFETVILAAQVRAHIENRALVLNKLIEAVQKSAEIVEMEEQGAAKELLTVVKDSISQTIKHEKYIHSKLVEDWDRWRYADDPMKTTGGENLIGSFNISLTYFRTLQARLETVLERIETQKELDWKALLARPETDEVQTFSDTGDV